MKKVNNVFKQIFLVMCLVCIFREIVFAANESGGAEAVVGNGEFVSDPEIEKLINQKEADMEKYFQMKQARALSENMITAILQHPQETGNWCGFSSIQSLLEGRNISISQSIIVNEIPSVTNFSSYNLNSNGCPWLMVHGNDVSQFPAAVYLNNKLGNFYYAPYPYGDAGTTTLTEANIRARVVYDIDKGYGVMVCGTSYANGDSHLPNYPLSEIGHWIVIRGYRDNGNTLLKVDPAHSDAVSWGGNVAPYGTVPIKTLTAFAQPKGIIY